MMTVDGGDGVNRIDGRSNKMARLTFCQNTQMRDKIHNRHTPRFESSSQNPCRVRVAVWRRMGYASLLVCLVGLILLPRPCDAATATALRIAVLQSGHVPTLGNPNPADQSLAVQLALSLAQQSNTSFFNATVSTVMDRTNLTVADSIALAQASSVRCARRTRRQWLDLGGSWVRGADLFHGTDA